MEMAYRTVLPCGAHRHQSHCRESVRRGGILVLHDQNHADCGSDCHRRGDAVPRFQLPGHAYRRRGRHGFRCHCEPYEHYRRLPACAERLDELLHELPDGVLRLPAHRIRRRDRIRNAEPTQGVTEGRQRADHAHPHLLRGRARGHHGHRAVAQLPPERGRLVRLPVHHGVQIRWARLGRRARVLRGDHRSRVGTQFADLLGGPPPIPACAGLRIARYAAPR